MATTTMNPSVLETAGTSGRGLETIRTFFKIAGAAIRCAAAVESGRRPNGQDLKTLGIAESMGSTPLLGR